MHFGSHVNYWDVDNGLIDVSRGSTSSLTINLEDNRQLRFDPHRSAIIVIDMQNFFGSEKLGRGPAARDIVPNLNRLIAGGREAGLRVAWVNWGNREDLANLPPSVLYTFGKHQNSPGIGGPLPDGLGPALVKDTWSTELLDDLKVALDSHDWWVDKYRLSGFAGTVLDAALRAAGIQTLFFTGVNIDQCVWSTLLDATNLGYDCVLVKDCAATSSPSFCYDAVVYNIARQTGLVTTADKFCAVANPH
jgi:nicotinamidase-related amidase